MADILLKSAGLEIDLTHLAQEMNRMAYTTHPAGSAALQYARHEFRELEATFHSKVAQLAALGDSALAAGLSDQVARAGAHLDWCAARPAPRPVPSAAGGARYVLERDVLDMLIPGFYKALLEWGGVVVKVWPKQPGSSATRFTISLDCVDELFELATYMVLNHYQGKVEGALRG